MKPLWKIVWKYLEKIKNRTTSWASNPTSGYISKRIEIRLSKRYMHSHIHCSYIHNSWDMAVTQMSFSEWMDFKMSHTHTHTHTHTHVLEYYLAFKRKEILPFAKTWMNLEGIILSEISQTQKDKCCMISLIYEFK